MARLRFSIGMAGVSYISVGSLIIEIEIGNNTYSYAVLTTGSELTTLADAQTVSPVQIPDHPILHNFAGQDVQFNLTGGVFSGGRTELELKIFYSSGNTTNPVYTVRAGASVNGTIISPVKIYTNNFSRRILR